MNGVGFSPDVALGLGQVVPEPPLLEEQKARLPPEEELPLIVSLPEDAGQHIDVAA